MAIEEINKLKELDFAKQVAFAYLTCERLYPNYVYFSDNFSFGNPAVLRDAIDYLYHNLFEINPDKPKINLLIKNVDKNTPDTEDFTTILVSAALDTCTAINNSLSFLADKDFSKIEFISTYGIDTVSMYIQEVENIQLSKKEINQRVNKHPLMEKKIQTQQGIIIFLYNATSINYDDIQTLLHLQEYNKKGNLNL